jgi:hypothetical protein
MSGREHWLPRLKPLGARVEIPYRRQLTADETAALRAGLWPKDMDDRWVVFLSDTALGIHRSWSGNAIYSLPRSISVEGADVLGPLFVSDDIAEYHRGDSARDIEMVNSLITQTVERSRKT